MPRDEQDLRSDGPHCVRGGRASVNGRTCGERPRAVRLLVWALLLAASVGACKSMTPPSMAPEAYRDYGGGYGSSYGSDGGGEAEIGSDVRQESTPADAPSPTMSADGDMDAPEAPKRKFSGGRRERAEYKDAGPSGGAAAPEPMPPPPDGAPQDTTHTGQDKEPTSAEASDPSAGHDRLIIYVANLVLSVFNVTEVTKRVELLPALLGGYVQSRREGYVVLKVPAARLGEAMELLSTYGVVIRRELAADDVTAEFVDLESRIRVLRDMQAHLLFLLKRARTVDEALHVRVALDRVTMELELALGRIRVLSNLIEFSTLSVELQEQGPHLAPPSNDPFPWVDSLGVEATEFN